MQKIISIIILSILMLGCSANQSIDIEPINGIKFSLPMESKFRLQMQDAEIYIYQEKTLVGSIQRVPTISGHTAVEALKEGFTEAQKGSNKPTVIDTANDGFGFSVNVDDYTTLFIASDNNQSHWAVISIKREHFDYLVSRLQIK